MSFFLPPGTLPSIVHVCDFAAVEDRVDRLRDQVRHYGETENYDPVLLEGHIKAVAKKQRLDHLPLLARWRPSHTQHPCWTM